MDSTASCASAFEAAHYDFQALYGHQRVVSRKMVNSRIKVRENMMFLYSENKYCYRSSYAFRYRLVLRSVESGEEGDGVGSEYLPPARHQAKLEVRHPARHEMFVNKQARSKRCNMKGCHEMIFD